MILDTNDFLNLLLENKEVQRVSRRLCPRKVNDFFLFKSSGVPRTVLSSLAFEILTKFKNQETLLEGILGVTDLKLVGYTPRLTDSEIPLGRINTNEFLTPSNICLYRDGEKLYVSCLK